MSQQELGLNIEHKEAIGQLTWEAASGGGIFLIGGIIGKIVHFLLQILLSRCLQARAYGMFCLGITITTFVASISSLGLHNGVLRFVAIYRGERDKSRLKGTLITAIVFSSLSSVSASALLFAFSGVVANSFGEPDLADVIRIFSISIPFIVLIILIAYAARAFRVMQYDIGLRSVLPPVIRIALIGMVFLLGFRLRGAVLAFSASNILCTVLGQYILWRIFPDIVSGLKPIYETRRLLKFSLPVMVAGFANLLLVRIDRLMLGWLGSSSDVGVYNAAAMTALQAGFVIAAFGASFSPMISDLYNKGRKDELERLFQTTTRWIFTISLPITVVLISFPRSIITLFGLDFGAGWLAVVVLSVACLINAGVGTSGFMLIMSGRQNVELFNTLVMMILNITLNFWLIRLYGITGAAIATGGSMTAINIMRVWEVRMFLEVQPYNRRYIKPSLAGLTVIAIPLFMGSRLGWVICSVAIGLVYGALLYFLGFEEEDRMILSTAKAKIKAMT